LLFNYFRQRESVKKPTPPPNIHSCAQPAKCCQQCIYTIQFVTRTNRRQTYFGTLLEQVAADNKVRLVDALLAALNAKKTYAACKALYDLP
jgi:hypothetical protein